MNQGLKRNKSLNLAQQDKPTAPLSATKKFAMPPFLKNAQLELMIFFVLGLEFLANAPAPIELLEGTKVYYLMSYNVFGFCNRMWMGSLLEWLSIHKTDLSIWVFVYVHTVLLIALFAVVAGMFVRNAPAALQKVTVVFIAFFLVMPTNFTYLFYSVGYGRLELYHLLLLLVAILIVFYKKFIWLLPFICAIGMAIHTAFLFLFAPLLLLILLYEAMQHNYQKKFCAVCGISLLVLFVSALYFQFFAINALTVSSCKEMMEIIQSYTAIDISYSEYIIETIYFGTFFDQTLSYTLSSPTGYLLLFFLGVPLLLPVWGSFVVFWKMAYKRCENKLQKGYILAFALLPICTIPLFVMTIDVWRWTACICFVQALSILYLLAKKDEAVVATTEKAQEWMLHHWKVVIMLFVYGVALGRIQNVVCGLALTYRCIALKPLLETLWEMFSQLL